MLGRRNYESASSENEKSDARNWRRKRNERKKRLPMLASPPHTPTLVRVRRSTHGQTVNHHLLLPLHPQPQPPQRLRVSLHHLQHELSLAVKMPTLIDHTTRLSDQRLGACPTQTCPSHHGPHLSQRRVRHRRHLFEVLTPQKIPTRL